MAGLYKQLLHDLDYDSDAFVHFLLGDIRMKVKVLVSGRFRDITSSNGKRITAFPRCGSICLMPRSLFRSIIMAISRLIPVTTRSRSWSMFATVAWVFGLISLKPFLSNRGLDHVFVRQHSKQGSVWMGQYSSIFLLPEGAGLQIGGALLLASVSCVGVSFIARLILNR